MNEHKVSDHLPFYWRLRSPNEEEFSLNRAPFSYTLSSEGVLIQKRHKEVLDALRIIYEQPANIGYFQPGYGFGEHYFSDILNFLQEVVGRVEPKGLFVEIGCGAMLVLARVRQMGFKVLGVDPSPISREASMRFGIEIISDFFGPHTAVKEAQVIFHYDVLEHIEDPLTFLSMQHGMLQEGGFLVFSVPDPEESMRIGDVSAAMHQHLNYFSKRSLKGLLQRAGFANIRIEKASYGGSLNVSAVKNGFAASVVSQVSNNLETNFFERVSHSQENFSRGIESLTRFGREIGLYVPLRALPYLDRLQSCFDLINMRMIDDTPAWNEKSFDGCSIPIENLDQFQKDPSPITVIFSLTFAEVLHRKLHSVRTHSISLSKLLSTESP